MCIFCKIVNGELPSTKVHENSEFLAFNDINPKAPIHILVIPKAHVESFEDADPQMIGRMSSFIKEITDDLCLNKNGYRLIVNNGEDGGQEVGHLHFHILGGAKLNWTHLTKDATKNFI